MIRAADRSRQGTGVHRSYARTAGRPGASRGGPREMASAADGREHDRPGQSGTTVFGRERPRELVAGGGGAGGPGWGGGARAQPSIAALLRSVQTERDGDK